MRIGCLQFAPQVGDTENNLNRADAVLSKANPEELDLLVLPELAFSGYNFKSLQDITPFLEPSGSGITSLWARTMALKYNCIVTVGYPEKVDVSPKWPTGPEYYNSAIVVNEEGETIANYRKAFLYYTDQTWALEGNKGFFEGVIPGLGNCSIGICMDINPYKFEAPWHAFEFAFHVLEMQSNLVILSMAWLTREEPRQFSRMPNEPDMETLTYWVTRLEPLIRSDNEDEIIVVFCNRTGSEDEAIYAGTSAVVGIQDGEVKVYGLLGRGEKELLVVDTNKSPYAKLIYCPPEDGAEPDAARLAKSQTPNGSSGAAPPGGKSTGQGSNQGQSKTPNGSKPEDGQRGSPGSKSASATSESGRSTSTSVNGKNQSYYQAEPKVNGTSGTPKKRSAAPIQLPSTMEASKNGGAMSPGSENFNGIPTPSAPSPTPMAIRPRLIIPESPPIQPYQYPPDHPMSAASLNSEKSMGSFKSDESEASVATVKSNPRPPEESTPFPHSGAPLSGYPENAWSEDAKRIYGGAVSITQFDEFSPTTPFQDISPASPRFFWRPPDNLLRTPSSALTAGWTPGTPIGRKPEPFPWPEITGAAQKPKKAEEEPARAPKSAVEGLRNGCSSPQSNASSNRTAKSSKSARSSSTTGRSTSTTGRSKKSSKEEQSEHRPGRPFSPKSRNASRSRNNERSNSSLGERETAAVVAMHLEGISQRAESATSMRKESTSATPIPDRPESPKSRNCSRNRDRVVETEVTAGPHTIPIAASPSLLRHTSTPEARSFYQQAPLGAVGLLHNRTNSLINGSGRFSPAQNITPTGSNIDRPGSRTASRGRQPGPQGPFDSMSVRSTSQDSTRNDRLHTRVSRRRESNGRSAAGSARSGRRSSNQDEDLSQYQRVESILCPNCPVHGAGSESQSASEASASDNDSRRQSSESQGGSRGETHSHSHSHAHMHIDTSNAERSVSASDRAAASDCSSSADTLQTASSSEKSPATPSLFDPPTPRAMSFSADEYTLDSAVTLDTPTPTDAAGKSFGDREIPQSAGIPTSAA